jgi:indolepyruvate ferredoxin oxidoreductase alpha subunit
MVILDNRATAMTGFQPHPGVGFNAVGEETPVVDIEAICKSLGIPVEIMDPFELDQVTYRLVELIQEEGLKVVIMRRPCALLRPKEEKPPFRLWVDAQKCLGEECGCNRYCVRVFKCPGLAWDRVNRKAQIDEAICVGCGVCASICPTSAIVKEPTDANIETV